MYLLRRPQAIEIHNTELGINSRNDPSHRKLYSNTTFNNWPQRNHGWTTVSADALRSFIFYAAYYNGTLSYMLSNLSLRNILRILLAYFWILVASSSTVVMADTNIANRLHTDGRTADYSILYEVFGCLLLGFIFGAYFSALVSLLKRSGTSFWQIGAASSLVVSLLSGVLYGQNGLRLIVSILFG